MESTKFPHSKFYTHGDVNALVHIMLHAGSSGMQAGAFSLVAGLSDAMMRSCLAAPSVRAEQWSRSADRAAEGTTSRSVSLVELLLRLQAPPPPTLRQHIQWKVGGQEQAEMEGNSQYAIIKWSPLYW